MKLALMSARVQASRPEVKGAPSAAGDATMSNEKISRTVLPIPDRAHVGLTTYDAKDPDTKYPPIALRLNC